jgi:hypothetical protein
MAFFYGAMVTPGARSSMLTWIMDCDLLAIPGMIEAGKDVL